MKHLKAPKDDLFERCRSDLIKPNEQIWSNFDPLFLGVWNFKTKVTLYFLPQYQSSVDFFTTLDVFE